MQPILTTHHMMPTLTQLDLDGIRQSLREAQAKALTQQGHKPTRTLSADGSILSDITRENDRPSNLPSTPHVAKRAKSTLVLSITKRLRSMKSILQQPPSARSDVSSTDRSSHASKLSFSVDDLAVESSSSDNEKENENTTCDSTSIEQSKAHRRRSSSFSYPSSVEREMIQAAKIKKLHSANSQLMLEQSRNQTTYQAVLSEKDCEITNMRITIQSLKFQISELEKQPRNPTAQRAGPGHRSNQSSNSSVSSSCSGADALNALLDDESQPDSPLSTDDIEVTLCHRLADANLEEDVVESCSSDTDTDVEVDPDTPRMTQAPAYALMTPGSSPLLTPGRLAKLSESFNDSLISFKIPPSFLHQEPVQSSARSLVVSSAKKPSVTQSPAPSQVARTTTSTPRSRIPEFVSPARRASQQFQQFQQTTHQTPHQASPASRRQSLAHSEVKLRVNQTPKQTPKSVSHVFNVDLSSSMPALDFSVAAAEPVPAETNDKPVDSVQEAWAMFQANKKKNKVIRSQTEKHVSQTPDSKRRPASSNGKRETVGTSSVESDSQIVQRSISQPQPAAHQRSDTVIDLKPSLTTQLSVVPSTLPISSLPTVPFTSAEAKRFQQEVRRHRATLHLSNDWTIRVKGLNSIEELVRENRASIPVWNDWPKELELMRPALIEQVSDLRSSIVREACKCLLALCEASPSAFEREFEQYLPYLAKGLYVTIKVIKDNSDDCLNGLVAMLNSQRVLTSLIGLLTDIHAVVREKSIGYITLIVENMSSAPAVEACAGDLQSVIAKHCQDGDNATRVACRNLYRIFALKFSARASAMEASMPAAVRKALDTDAKQKKSSNTTKTTKKKK